MLKFKKISRFPAVFLIILGFLAGPFLSEAQTSCCCDSVDNCCCCSTDVVELIENELSDSSAGSCGCEIKDVEPPELEASAAQNFSKSDISINSIYSMMSCREIPVVLNYYIPANSVLIRNLGPPVYISVSSLLI